MTVVRGMAAGRAKSRRWRLPLIVSLVAVVLLASAAVLVLRQRTEPEQPPPAWDQIMAMAEPDGTVGLEMALAAFSLLIAPLPGVTPPSGRVDDRLHSGSLAISALQAHWDALTPEQQEAAAPYLNPSGDAATVPAGSDRSGRITTVATAQAALPCEFPYPTRAADADQLKQLRDHATNLGRLFDPPIVLDADLQLCHAGRDLPPSPLPNGTVLDTASLNLSNVDPATDRLRCWVVLFPKLPKSDRTRAMYHELTHCFTNQLVRKQAGTIFVPRVAWVTEGIAEWVASQVTNTNWVDPTTYPLRPQLPLTQRSYDAVGFFAHLHHIRNDNWSMIPLIINAYATGGGAAAFDTALSGHELQLLSTWPASWLQDPARGSGPAIVGPWHMATRGAALHYAQPIKATLVEDGEPVRVGSGAWAVQLDEVDLRAELVLITPAAGGPAWGRFGPGPDGDFNLADAAGRIFCTKPGGCTCEDGSPLPTAGIVTDIPPGQSYIAVTGGRESAEVIVQGVSVDKFCKSPEKYRRPGGPVVTEPLPAVPSLPTSGCQGSCGGSDRDPHLNTFDGLFYDLQSVGEYTLVAGTGDDLEVQARTAPVDGSTTASVNVAIAVRVAGDRVGVYLPPGGGAEVRVNGEVTQVDAEVTLPGGGTLDYVEGNYTLTWPDGTQAWIIPLGETVASITFQLSPADARKEQLTGLLGDYDGDLGNDLRLRDGTVVTDASFEQLHTTIVDSWRVTDASSLFDYAPGQSTATFTDLALPSGPVTAENSPNREAAEAACRQAGVTDPVQLANCIVDVGVTGDDAYAAVAASMQRFLSRVVGPGQRVTDGVAAGGEITSAGQRDRFPLDLGGAAVFFVAGWAGPTLGCDQALSISLLEVTYDHRPCSEQTVRLRVADPGAGYELEVVGVDGQTGRYQFQLITQKQRDFDFDLGGTAAGSIDVVGRADAYAFAPPASGQLLLTGNFECGTGIFYELVNLASQQEERSPRSFCGDEPITVDHPGDRYAVVITHGELGTGEYSFRLQAG